MYWVYVFNRHFSDLGYNIVAIPANFCPKRIWRGRYRGDGAGILFPRCLSRGMLSGGSWQIRQSWRWEVYEFETERVKTYKMTRALSDYTDQAAHPRRLTQWNLDGLFAERMLRLIQVFVWFTCEFVCFCCTLAHLTSAIYPDKMVCSILNF